MKWRSLYPTYLYRLWSLEEVLAIAADDQVIGERLRAVIQSLRFPAAQADVARLILLRTFGGFWVDLKLDPHCRFLTPLLDFDLVLTEHFPQPHRPEPNGFLINSFIGSDRHTQFMDRVLKRVLSNLERRVQASTFDVTGPRNLLKVKEEMANLPGGIGSYTVLPHTETWGKLFSLQAAPYNDNGMHWSVRELREPIYNDASLADSQGAELQKPLSALEPETDQLIISQLRTQIAGLNAESEALSRRLELVLRSTSWKISAPIRMVGRRLPMVARLSRTIVAQFRSLQSGRGRNVMLVAADAPPMSDRQSGGLRLHNLIRIFCEMDHQVVFASQCSREDFAGIAGSAEHRKRYEDLLYATGVRGILYGPKEAEYLIRVLGSELRWAFLSFPNVADQFIPPIRSHAPCATVMYDMVDFHSLRMSREAKLKSDATLQAAAEHMRLTELANAKTADVTIAVSELERERLLAIDSSLVVEVIPNVFDLPSNARLQIDGRSGLLFVGGFRHSPNVDAVLWFVRDIWPRIRSQRPEMVFRIVGSNLSEQIICLLKQPGVEVLDYVSDLSGLFAYSRMSVAPLRYGAGVKGKIGQSMAYGLPIVTTRIGAEGMALEDGKHILIADEPEEFAAAVLQLATDDELWRRLQANGRDFIAHSQSMDVIRGKLRTLMNV